MLVDGDLKDAIESSYLLNDETEFVNDDESETFISDEDSILSVLNDHPLTLTEVKRSPDWNYWHEAMRKKVNIFEYKKTYIIIKKISEMEVLTDKWVYNCKLNNKSETIHFRAHWVVREFLQQQRIHYTKSYAAVVSSFISWVIFIITTVKGWKTKSIDYIFTFLNSMLLQHKMIYMQLSSSIKYSRGRLVELI